MTIDEALTSISIHLHLSKETEREILSEIRSHLEEAVADAVKRGRDEQAALQQAVEQFGVVEVATEIQEVHSHKQAIEAIFATALPVFFAVAMRWLVFAPDGSPNSWRQWLVQPGFYVLSIASLAIPVLIFRRWRYVLIGWGIFWFLTIIFVVFPSANYW